MVLIIYKRSGVNNFMYNHAGCCLPEHLHTHVSNIHKKCVDHIQKKVRLVTVDQHVYEGIIQHVDNNYVYLIVNDGVRDEENDHRYPPFGYGYPGFGYPGFGYGYPGFGYGYPGFGYPGYGPGLGGLIFPLFTLAALSAV